MRLIPTLIFIVCILVVNCDETTGLEPVSGIKGELTFNGDWNQEIQAAAIIALDDIDLENPASNLVTYSNLVDPGTIDTEYFIQLLPGQYYLAAVGITVDPGYFAVKIDSFLALDNIPLEIIDKDLRNLTTPVPVNYQEITKVDRVITF